MLCVDITSTFALFRLGAKARMARNLLGRTALVDSDGVSEAHMRIKNREQRGTAHEEPD
jgi:hypothetical protein